MLSFTFLENSFLLPFSIFTKSLVAIRAFLTLPVSMPDIPFVLGSVAVAKLVPIKAPTPERDVCR